MFNSKKTFDLSSILSFTIAASALFATGCWKPGKTNDLNNGPDDAAASFKVVEMSNESRVMTPRADGENWRLSDHKEVYVKFCLADRILSKPTRQHLFDIEMVERKQRIPDRMSDNKGCVDWTESISYNPLAEKPTYVELVRRIYGKGVHLGYREVHIAVNPWAGERGEKGDKSSGVIWLHHGNEIPTSQLVRADGTPAALSNGANGGKASVWIENFDPVVSLKDEKDGRTDRVAFEDEEGALLEVMIKMNPKIHVEGLDGQHNYIELKSGQFTVWAQLVAVDTGVNRDKRILLTPRLVPMDGIVKNGVMEVTVPVGLTRMTKRGRLAIALKVVPKKLPYEVAPFEGLYIVGDVAQILKAGRPRMSWEEGKFNYSDYVAKADNFEELKSAQMASSYEPFIYETATVQFAGIRPGETATMRTVEYQVTTCVRDNLSGDRVVNQPFTILDEKGQEIKVKRSDGTVGPAMTNTDGCLVWTSSITHRYYQPEEYFFPKFTLVHPRTGVAKGKIKELVVNPWDAMFRTFGWDMQQFPQEFVDKVKNRKKVKSYLSVTSYATHAIRFRYEIDRFMELWVRKQVLLHLKPEVLRYSGIIGGRKVTESLRDGIYLMKVALQKDFLDPSDRSYALVPHRDRDAEGKRVNALVVRKGSKLEPKHFVTAVKKLVRVNSGEINTPIEFSVQDLRLMRIRTQFLIELQPIDEQALQLANVLEDDSTAKIKEVAENRGLKPEEASALKAKRIQDTESLIKKLYASAPVQHQNAQVNQGSRADYDWRLYSSQDWQNFDLSKQVADRLVDELATNDFTRTKAAPVVDLDLLVEDPKISGLAGRTFVGPMIFLSNSYGDDLRPTDNLDESVCAVSDCDELKTRELESRVRVQSNQYDSSKYYGAMKHLANIQVDQLVKEYQASRAAYAKFMPALASLGNFVRLYNLDFLSLSNERLMGMKPDCYKESECLEPVTEHQLDARKILGSDESAVWAKAEEKIANAVPQDQARSLKAASQAKVTRKDWDDLAKEGVISNALGQVLCRQFAKNVEPNWAQKIGLNFFSAAEQAYWACFRGIYLKQPSILVDRRMRVYETGDYVFRGGKQMNLNVGANFSLNHNVSTSAGAGFNFADLPFLGPMMGLLGQTVGLAAKSVADFTKSWLKPISLKVGVDTSRSMSDGTSVSESTYLVVQQANFTVGLTKYERCSIVHLNPEVVKGSDFFGQLGWLNSEKAKAGLGRGLMVCSGEVESKRMDVHESYYYSTQHFTEGDMLDQSDLFNHPWLLALRGARDFSTFVRLIRAQEFTMFAPFKRVVDKPGWALDQMVNAYKQVLPSFPGLYTLTTNGERLMEFPFDQEIDDPSAIVK